MKQLALAFLMCATSSAFSAHAQQPNATVPSPDSELRIGDWLMITVWKEPEMSGSVVVRADGTITLPVLNDVRVAGLKPTELEQLLTEKLKQYITNPRVTVTVRGKQSPVRNLPLLLEKPRKPTPEPSPDLLQKCCSA